MRVTGAEALMKILVKEQVKVVFGYPGGAIMPIYDALYHYENKIRHVLVRHEQGAAHAAEGYARISRKPGVCFATSGPGATNLVTGIADAMLDCVPIVCITGQVAAHLIGSDAFQEIDIIGITTPITKWNYQVTKAEEIPEAVTHAFRIAVSKRPGPVLIDITKNAQSEVFDFKFPKKQKLKDSHFFTQPKKSDILKAAKLINSAKKPYLFVGHGVLISHAEKEVVKLAEKAGIPTATTLHGLSAFPSNHKLYVGMLGMHGNYGANRLTNKADVIISLGMRFDDRVTGRLSDYAKQAKIIHVDIDPAELGKNISPAIAINADVKEVLTMLLPLIMRNKHTEWLKEFTDEYEVEYKKVIQQEFAPKSEKIKMAEVVHMITQKTKGEAIVVADVGQHQMVSARYYKGKNPNSYITSGGLGTMGFALPAAIGAKIAAPKKEVIAIIGDGSFQMTIQELATIAQEHLSVKIVILNNNFLGMVRQWQELFFDNRYSFVNLKNPDFTAVAKSFFVDAEKIENRKDLKKGIEHMLNAKKAYLLEVIVAKEENVFPMIATGASVEEIRLE